jgi:hypothetical protein
MGRVASVLLGLVLGLAGLEATVRLGTYEHEADGNYWGRDAFVADPVLGYRHKPSATATYGRFGQLGPARITTNALGYRDTRLPDTDGPVTDGQAPPRLLVVGASFMFGLGIDDDEAIFPVQLERALRARDDMPDDLQVFNVSQTGYLAHELSLLALEELDRFAPRMVLLVLRPVSEAARIPEGETVDIVNGYRLASTRDAQGGWLDELRTRSSAFMHVVRSPLLAPGTYVDEQLLLDIPALSSWRPEAPEETRDTAAMQAGRAQVLDEIGELGRALAEEGIEFRCMVISPPRSRSNWLGRALSDAPIAFIEVRSRLEWTRETDMHWTAEGHRLVAELVAPSIPAAPFR